MKLTYNWLKGFVDLSSRSTEDEGPHKIARLLTMAGLEVESIQAPASGQEIVVARVTDVRRHPKADRLFLCTVDSGGEALQVVCGAPNVRVGIKAPLAKVGAVLPSGLNIKPATIRGESSHGMLCSENELGLSKDHEGILILPEDAPIGRALFSYLGMDDWILEVGVTPNRGDCLGILGMAREISTLTGAKLKSLPSTPHTKDTSLTRLVQVRIENPKLCSRYSARVVEHLEIRPSPPWIRFRLEACGVRSINNVVDITNYVMLETGQPLHAFDMDRLYSKRIEVRPAKLTKKFTTLDGVERELSADDLLICDGETPVALAGVMGGSNSEVGQDTHSVLLESANFVPTSIRRTAKRLGLHSEASHRFERGVDPEGTLFALNRAAYLLEKVSGGRAVPGVVDRYPRKFKASPIVIRDEKVKELLGIAINRKKLEQSLKSLGAKIQGHSKSALKVSPPSYRFDLSREADLIEELARLHGYEKIPSTLPLVRPQGSLLDPTLRWGRRLRSYLTGEGLTEVINIPFTSTESNECFHGLWVDQEKAVAILNPLKQESSEMRLSLIPGLLENLRLQIDHRATRFLAFEIGKVFHLTPSGSNVEKTVLAGLLYGSRGQMGLRTEDFPPSFLDVKGILEGILDAAGTAESAAWTSENLPSFLHPGKAATLNQNGRKMSYLGEIHPDLSSRFRLPNFLIFELDFESLVKYARLDLTVRALPRFPSVERDLAIVVNEKFPAQQIIKWIKGFGNLLIEDVRIFDQYSGSPIPEGKKSLGYTVCYRTQDRTLTDEEVNSTHQNLISKMCQEFAATLRE